MKKLTDADIDRLSEEFLQRLFELSLEHAQLEEIRKQARAIVKELKELSSKDSSSLSKASKELLDSLPEFIEHCRESELAIIDSIEQEKRDIKELFFSLEIAARRDSMRKKLYENYIRIKKSADLNLSSIVKDYAKVPFSNLEAQIKA